MLCDSNGEQGDGCALQKPKSLAASLAGGRWHPGQRETQKGIKEVLGPSCKPEPGGWYRGGGMYQGTQQLTLLGAATSAEDFGESFLNAACWR